MIRELRLTNTGPADALNLGFHQRLNVITGDNGLGKSFLLDATWWALTRRWPGEVNPRITGGRMARPTLPKDAQIAFSFDAKSKTVTYDATFDAKQQAWLGKPGRPPNPGLVLYAMSDGSFAVWDPHRNYWLTRDGDDVQERVPAYVFSARQVWDGLHDESGAVLCNGLIRDWASWQKENGATFTYLKRALKALSPTDTDAITPGELTRISLDDARDIPTVRMPYGKDVPVVHASSGMNRVMSLAYFLVWAWEEHRRAAQLLGEPTANQVTFLVDEIESHLHPSWQRTIVPAVLSVMDALTTDLDGSPSDATVNVQLITATHSPLIMTSVEPIFNAEKDAWFDLDFVAGRVELTQRVFEKLGDSSNWLTSEAFDLTSSRSVEYEHLLEEAAALLDRASPDRTVVREMHEKLLKALNPMDDFLFRWRAVCEQSGWLSDSR